MTTPTLRERLARIEIQLDRMETLFTNHLHTHAKYTYLAFATLLGMIVTLILMLIKLG